jgi:hypothetical protein
LDKKNLNKTLASAYRGRLYYYPIRFISSIDFLYSVVFDPSYYMKKNQAFI